MIRKPLKKLQARTSTDGDGVSLQRWGLLERSDGDPFLLIDEFRLAQGDPSQGFPEHPHRGFETITLMKSGGISHRDHMGHHSRIGADEVQWMTAGSGVIHEEIPDTSSESVHGFQLWLNLPREDKWIEPAYQELKQDQIPVLEHEGVTLRLLAGSHEGMNTAIQRPKLKLKLMDVSLAPGAKLELPIPQSQLLWLQYQGSSRSAGIEIQNGELCFYSPGEQIEIQAGGNSEVKGLLLAAEPLKEPLVHYGPFVMNSRDEIEQALNDYQTGRLVRS